VGIRVIDLQNPNSLEVAYMLKDHGGCLQLAIEDDILLASYENTVVSYDLTDIPAQPSSFSLISPNGQIKNTDTTLLWHKSTDPNGNEVEYEVWMADNDQFNNKIVERTKDTFLHINNLLPEQTVYWKVWALDDIKDSVESSETFQFNLPAMECLSPSGYIINGNTDTSLVWSPGVNDEKAYLTYRVWVADNEQFNNKTIHQTSDTFLNISNLLPGQKKYWKVFAYNQQSDSMVSKNELNFELANIWLNGPMGSLRKGLSDTTLSWNPRIRGNTEAIDYDILLSTEENFTNAIFLSSQDTFVNVYGLQGGQTYHWRVRARNLFDTSIFTDFFGKFSIAIDQPDLVFSKNLGASLGGGVSCLQDNALYASSTSKVHRFNTSGQEQYTLEVNGQIKASTSITPDHRVYIASTDNNLYAFNQNGVSVQGWPVALGSQLEASVAIDDDHRLYLGTANGIYQCVSSAGNVLWSYNTGASVKASSAITQGDTLIVVNSQGRVFAFDLNNIQGASPSPIWSIRTNRPISNSPAIKGDAIYLCSDDGYLIKITHGNTAASIAYSKKVATQILSSPVVDEDDIVYFGASKGSVLAIHGNTGEIKWEKPTYYSQNSSDAIKSTGALSGDGALYIGDVHGVMYCFNTENGELFWSYRGPEEIIKGAIVYKDKEVFFTSGATLISLRESNRLRKKTPNYSGWLSFQGNNERTGNLDDIANAGTSAIKSLTEAFGVQLYPNPNDGSFFITSNDPNAVFQLEVSDLSGKVIYKDDLFRAGSRALSLKLNQGLYFVRLQKEGASSVFRMIVE
jgi:outer membrane protein assembly factor BamB